MEKNSRIPPRMDAKALSENLNSIGSVIHEMADPDIFVWFGRTKSPAEEEIRRAATIIADRLCGAVSDPIIRNAQEARQLGSIERWLTVKGYQKINKADKFDAMKPGTFSLHTNVPITNPEGNKINVSVDIVILPHTAISGSFPLLIEAKSAGDFTNVNKRRKEEAQKMAQLRNTYGDAVNYGLFLNGYFDSGYLGYEAAEGIDWVWEHRIDDFEKYGL
jgi:type II restriction enzyme